MDVQRGRMVFLGYGKYWRSDRILGLMPIEEGRGPGQSRASSRTWVRPTRASSSRRCGKRRASCSRHFTNSRRCSGVPCRTSITSMSRNGKDGSARCCDRPSIPTPRSRTTCSTERVRMTQPEASATQADRGWFGHPRGLSTLFFTEMWERFSFYGLRALLILYMTAAAAKGGLGFSTEHAASIYGWYTFGVYAAAIPGGIIADRWLGQFRSVLWGGVIIALGHFNLAYPSLPTFYLGLTLIVL